MGKICRVKQRTKTHNKRKDFLGVRKDFVNIVNTGINLSNINNESIKDNLVNSNVNSTILPKSDNEQILNPQKLSGSSSKVQSIEVTPANKKEDISGNRIIDANILSDVFCELLCPMCEQRSLVFGERHEKKQGLASLLYIKCSTRNCKYIYEFFTSTKVNKCFEINQRMVYTTRSLGHGYAGIEKFNTLMNMPKPMTVKNYNKTVSRIKKVVKAVAEETMDDAAKKIHDSAASTDDIVNTSVSGDGTWQRKGFSSFNGVFAAISTESGIV